jgi:hypothetical protein
VYECFTIVGINCTGYLLITPRHSIKKIVYKATILANNDVNFDPYHYVDYFTTIT